MALWIEISPGSHEPIYGQIVSQVDRAIAMGELLPGDRLPAVRKLAAELVINPNTVARAYMVLDEQGLVVSKTGSGTFVADPAMADRDAAELNALSERIDGIIARAMNMGLAAREITRLFAARLKAFTGRRQGGQKDE